jgi:hypothetical protein
MSAAEKELRELRILWIALADGSLRMTWTDEALFAGGNYGNLKKRRYGR